MNLQAATDLLGLLAGERHNARSSALRPKDRAELADLDMTAAAELPTRSTPHLNRIRRNSG